MFLSPVATFDSGPRLQTTRQKALNRGLFVFAGTFLLIRLPSNSHELGLVGLLVFCLPPSTL